MRYRVRSVRCGREHLRYFASAAAADWEKYLLDKHWPDRRAVAEVWDGEKWLVALPDGRSIWAERQPYFRPRSSCA